MAEGRRRHDWSMQSHLMAHLARLFSDGKGEISASQFDPYAEHEPDEPEEVSMSELRSMLNGAH